MATGEIIDINDKLQRFLTRACPEIPDDLKCLMASEMTRSFDEWVLADESKRTAVLRDAQKRMITKLGISKEFLMELEFPKAEVNTETAVKAAEEKAKKLSLALEAKVSSFRRKLSLVPLQLSLHLEEVSTDDPQFVRLTYRGSGNDLAPAELKRAKGMMNWKKAGRPSRVVFDFGT